MLITKVYSDWCNLAAGGAAPNETEDVPPPGHGLGWGDLVDGHMFLSSTCHLPNLGALRDQVRNI